MQQLALLLLLLNQPNGEIFSPIFCIFGRKVSVKKRISFRLKFGEGQLPIAPPPPQRYCLVATIIAVNVVSVLEMSWVFCSVFVMPADMLQNSVDSVDFTEHVRFSRSCPTSCLLLTPMSLRCFPQVVQKQTSGEAVSWTVIARNICTKITIW